MRDLSLPNRNAKPAGARRFVTVFLVAAALATGACGTAAAPVAPSQASAEGREVMQRPAPPVQRFAARDGTELAYRFFAPPPGAPAPEVVAILLHGSAGSSLNMTVVGDAVAAAGIPAFAPDVRGQGLSGRRGDIDYIGQLDDDLNDLVVVVRRSFPEARLVLVGASAGGGFVLRVAGEEEGRAFSRFVSLAPVLGRLAPTTPPRGAWARPNVPLITLLTGLNGIGITGFNHASVLSFAVPADAEALGLTRRWSYAMMMNYGPRGQTQLFGRPAYLTDAARAPAPIVVIAGTADEQFHAERYGDAFSGLPVEIELAPGVSHMGVLSDPGAVAMIVAAIKAP